jgi:uncharacterized protein YndB with AHSA1/START domain
MPASASPTTHPADLELSLTRVFDAPRELVFAAWTQAEHALHWFAPPGCSVTSCTMDLRVGGAWRSCMRWPDGSDHWQGGVFLEIVAPERLVFSYAWEDEHRRPKHQTVVTVRLEERGAKTALTFQQAVFASETSRTSHGGGWSGSLDVLAEYLERAKARGARA